MIPALQFNANNFNSKQPILNNLSPKKVADKVESYFIDDNPQLIALLELFSLTNIEAFFQSITNYFNNELKIGSLTIDDIEKLDLRKTAYDFVKYLNIPLPLIKDELEKKVTIDLLSKVGRILLHEVIFPEIEPQLAVIVKKLIKRNINKIAVIEGWDAKKINDNLKIEELPGEEPIGFIIPTITISPENRIDIFNSSPPTNVKEFYVCNFTDKEARKLANYLIEREVISKTTPFLELLFSQGRNIEPVECNPKNIKYLVCLIDKLYKSKIRAEKLLKMNYGKSYWKFAQQNFVQNDGQYFGTRFKNMNHELKKHPKIIQEIDQLIRDVFKT